MCGQVIAVVIGYKSECANVVLAFGLAAMNLKIQRDLANRLRCEFLPAILSLGGLNNPAEVEFENYMK